MLLLLGTDIPIKYAVFDPEVLLQVLLDRNRSIVVCTERIIFTYCLGMVYIVLSEYVHAGTLSSI